jgi:hypothetical protein
MEIITRGTPPSELMRKGTCQACKTEVKFRTDEGYPSSDERDGDVRWVDCPVCKRSAIYGTVKEYNEWVRAENARMDPY